MIAKHHLKKFIEKDKPKTALEYLLLITRKYPEYRHLEDLVIVKMAQWNRLINEEISTGVRLHKDWNKLNKDILEIINLLEDRTYDVKLLDSTEDIAKNLNYGTRGKWIKKIAQFFGILSALLILGITWISLDRKHFAFRYYFSDIETNDYCDSLDISEYIGNWELDRPYVIRRDTVDNNKLKIYYTIGKRAEVHLFCIDSNRLAGNEYIINTIFELNPKDTTRLEKEVNKYRTYKELVKSETFKKIATKISDINIVFHEELEFETENTGVRTGHYVGPIELESKFKNFFLSKEKKDIVKKILHKYNKKTIRDCEMAYGDGGVLKFTCEPIEDISGNYIKRIRKTRKN